MIIVDTNVLSALMQQKPEPTVVEWLDAQSAETVWITSMTLFEMRYGLKIVTDGQRKALLQDRFEKLVQIDLANRIVVFDVCAADRLAQIAALLKAVGAPWTSVIPSLPVSPLLMAQYWLPVTLNTLTTCLHRW